MTDEPPRTVSTGEGVSAAMPEDMLSGRDVTGDISEGLKLEWRRAAWGGCCSAGGWLKAEGGDCWAGGIALAGTALRVVTNDRLRSIPPA